MNMKHFLCLLFCLSFLLFPVYAQESYETYSGDTFKTGDILWRLTGDYSGASRIIDVVVREKGIYSVIDSTRGRIFTYDHEGNLLYIFGGIGSQEGTFDTPTAIDTIGDEIIVLDGSKKSCG